MLCVFAQALASVSAPHTQLLLLQCKLYIMP